MFTGVLKAWILLESVRRQRGRRSRNESEITDMGSIACACRYSNRIAECSAIGQSAPRGYTVWTVISTSYLEQFRPSGDLRPAKRETLIAASRAQRSSLGFRREKLVKGKISVRYIDFVSAGSGSRIFNFSITGEDRVDTPTSVEIPPSLLTGTNRIALQDGVRICYEKLRSLVGDSSAAKVPRRVSLTEADVADFRSNTKRPHA
jgi:hypothetical protein